VAGYSFIYICRSIKGIIKFQVRQDQVGEIRILLATDASFPADGKEQVAAAARARLASEDRIVVELVDDIQPAPSGKYRPVVSKVAEQLRQAGRLEPAALQR
jgi:phenylacetate-CoA ligase